LIVRSKSVALRNVKEGLSGTNAAYYWTNWQYSLWENFSWTDVA